MIRFRQPFIWLQENMHRQHLLYEPGHNKTAIRFVQPVKTKISLGCLISLCWSHEHSTANRLSKEGLTRPCHTEWMYRLLWVFAVYTCLIVGFPMHWLIQMIFCKKIFSTMYFHHLCKVLLMSTHNMWIDGEIRKKLVTMFSEKTDVSQPWIVSLSTTENYVKVTKIYPVLCYVPIIYPWKFGRIQPLVHKILHRQKSVTQIPTRSAPRPIMSPFHRLEDISPLFRWKKSI